MRARNLGRYAAAVVVAVTTLGVLPTGAGPAAAAADPSPPGSQNGVLVAGDSSGTAVITPGAGAGSVLPTPAARVDDLVETGEETLLWNEVSSAGDGRSVLGLGQYQGVPAIMRIYLDGRQGSDAVELLAPTGHGLCSDTASRVVGSAGLDAVYVACADETSDLATRLLRIDLPYVDEATSVEDVTPPVPAQLGPPTFIHFDVSPDGRWLAWTGNRYATCPATGGCAPLLRADLEAGTAAQALPRGIGDYQISRQDSAVAISPVDPDLIAVRVERAVKQGRILIVDAGAGQAAAVANDPAVADYRRPEWSPDGARLAWFAARQIPTPPGFPPSQDPDYPTNGPEYGDDAAYPGIAQRWVLETRPANASAPAQLAVPLPTPTYENRKSFVDGSGGVFLGFRDPYLSWQWRRPADVDLQLTQVVPDDLRVGQPFTVSYTVRNDGPAAADDVVLAISHTEGATHPDGSRVDDPLTHTTVTGADCVDSTAYDVDDDLTCILDESLPSGASATVTVTLAADRFGMFSMTAAARPADGQDDRSRGSRAMVEADLVVRDLLPDPTTDGRIVVRKASACVNGSGRGEQLLSVDPDGSDGVVLHEFPCTGVHVGTPRVQAGHVWWMEGVGEFSASRLMRQQVTGGAPATLVAQLGEAAPDNFAVSPDGTKVVYYGDRGLAMLDVANPASRILLRGPGARDGSPIGWTDSGARLVLDHLRSSSVSPALIGTGGGELRRLNGDLEHEVRDANQLLWGDDWSSAVQFGGDGPRRRSPECCTADLVPEPRHGIWTFDLADPDEGPPSSWRFLGSSSAHHEAALVSPTHHRIAYVDPDIDEGLDAPRLGLADIAGTAPYERNQVSIGLPAVPGDEIEVVGWSDVAPAPGGTPTVRAPRGIAPIALSGVQVGARTRSPDDAYAYVGASANGATALGRDIYAAKTVVVRTATGQVTRLDERAAAVSPDGRYVATISASNALSVLDTHTGARKLVPVPTGQVSLLPGEPRLRETTFTGVGNRILRWVQSATVMSLDWTAADPRIHVSEVTPGLLESHPRGLAAISRNGAFVAWGSDTAGTVVLRRIDARGDVTGPPLQIDVPDGQVLPSYYDSSFQVADNARVLVRVASDDWPADQGVDMIVDPLGDLTTNPATVLDIPGSRIDPTVPERQPSLFRSDARVTLSADGKHAWFATSGGPDALCGRAGLAVRDLDRGVTKCVGSLAPFHHRRGALDLPVQAGYAGTALIRTVRHHDVTDSTDVRDLVQVAVGADAAAPPAAPEVIALEVGMEAGAPVFTVTPGLRGSADPDDLKTWKVTFRDADDAEVHSVDVPVPAGDPLAPIEVDGGPGWSSSGTVCLAGSAMVDGTEQFGACSDAVTYTADGADRCPNIDGAQATVPSGMVDTGPAGWCVTPPGAPTALRAVIAGVGDAELHWQAPTSGGAVDHYVVQVDGFERVSAPGNLWFYWNRCEPHDWRVIAIGDDGSRSPAAYQHVDPPASCTPPPAVRAPSPIVGKPSVTARAGGKSVVRWTLRSPTATTPRTAVLVRYRGRVHVLSASATKYLAKGEKKGRRYTYAVATRGPGGTSQWATVTVRRRIR